MKLTDEQKSDIRNTLQRVEDSLRNADISLDEDLEKFLDDINDAAELLVRLGNRLEDIHG